MPHLHHVAFGSCEGFLTLFLLFTAAVYLRGWIQLRTVPSNALRACSFLLGLFLILVAVGSPLAMLDRQLLTAHMVQHLLLMTLAPPFIWLGAPVMPLSRGLPRRFVDVLIQATAVQRLGAALSRPVFSWLFAAAVLVTWHIPAALGLGLRSEAWHLFEHASFLVAGLLFWWPVIQPWPSATKWPEFAVILYLFFATLPCDVLAGLLVFGERDVYPAYGASRPFGLSALADQQCAGALMWTCVTVVFLIAGAIVTMRLLAPLGSSKHASATSHWPSSVASQEVPQIGEAR